MVKKWGAELNCGRESLEDDPHPRRPVTDTIQETTDKIQDMILRGSVCSTADGLKLTPSTLSHELINHHSYEKSSAIGYF